MSPRNKVGNEIMQTAGSSNSQRVQEKNTMTTNLHSHAIEQLLSEADKLIEKINADIIEELQEEQRVQFESRASDLRNIKLEVQAGIGKKNAGAEGIHEAILDIVKAMQGLTRYLS